MTKEQQKEVRKHLTNLSEWDKDEVDSFAQKWQSSRQDINKEVWSVVQRGIDIVLKYFENRVNPRASLSEGISHD